MNENNIKSRLSKMWGIVLLVFGILLVAVVFSGCGWGWFVPYSFQPSYHEFKEMCKLNELPNDEEKYNKILAYFDTDLDSLDWDELNKKALKLTKGSNVDYVEGRLEYRAKVARIQKERYYIAVDLYANNKGFSKENISHIATYGSWNTRRYTLSIDLWYNSRWIEETVSCSTIVTINSIFLNNWYYK